MGRCFQIETSAAFVTQELCKTASPFVILSAGVAVFCDAGVEGPLSRQTPSISRPSHSTGMTTRRPYRSPVALSKLQSYARPSIDSAGAVSYTHLRAHETY